MRSRLVAVLCLMLLPLPALAQSMTIGATVLDFADETMRPRTSAQKQFVDEYLAAVGTGNTDAVRALVHPASLACSSSDTSRDYLREVHSRDAKRVIPADHRTIVVPVVGDVPTLGALSDLTLIPVRPSEIFGLTYSTERRDDKGVLLRSIGATVLRLLAPHDGRLMIVEYCLTQKGEDLYRRKHSKDAEEDTAPRP